MNHKTTVDPMEVAKFAQHADEWWDLNGPLKTLHDINPARLEWIQQLGVLSGQKVLDIGCGGGILCEGLANAGAEVTGLDVEVDAILRAQQHAKETGLSIEYVCEPIEKYRLEESSSPFDLITCMEMLEHVPDPELVIQHASRLLKPNGLLLLSTINRTFKAYLTVILGAEYVLNILPRQTHDYAKFMKPSELTAMIRSYDLEAVSLSGLHYNPLTRIASLQRSVEINYLLACRKCST